MVLSLGAAALILSDAEVLLLQNLKWTLKTVHRDWEEPVRAGSSISGHGGPARVQGPTDRGLSGCMGCRLAFGKEVRQHMEGREGAWRHILGKEQEFALKQLAFSHTYLEIRDLNNCLT